MSAVLHAQSIFVLVLSSIRLTGPFAEHAPTAEKLLVAIMSLQKEGQLDTRMFAKQALARLKELLDSGGHSCATLVAKPGGKVDYAKVSICYSYLMSGRACLQLGILLSV